MYIYIATLKMIVPEWHFPLYGRQDMGIQGTFLSSMMRESQRRWWWTCDAISIINIIYATGRTMKKHEAIVQRRSIYFPIITHDR